jgi:hypothetical protein
LPAKLALLILGYPCTWHSVQAQLQLKHQRGVLCLLHFCCLQAVDVFLKGMGLTAAELAAQPDLADLMVAYHFIPGAP